VCISEGRKNITNTFKYPRKKEIEAKKKVLDSDDSYQKKRRENRN
jgi:hypothetical protein